MKPELILLLSGYAGLIFGVIAGYIWWHDQPTPKIIETVFGIGMSFTLFFFSALITSLSLVMIKGFVTWLRS